MKIEIETATNGYIITIPAEYEDSKYLLKINVIISSKAS